LETGIAEMVKHFDRQRGGLAATATKTRVAIARGDAHCIDVSKGEPSSAQSTVKASQCAAGNAVAVLGASRERLQNLRVPCGLSLAKANGFLDV
jgi:hypothetical protein